MHNELMKKYPEHRDTCPINDLRDGCFSFVRSGKYLVNCIDYPPIDAVVITPRGLRSMHDGWKYEAVDNPDYTFAMIHNELHVFDKPKGNIIGARCEIHSSAVLDAEGIHVCKAPDGSRVQLKHLGNVVLEDDVMILANVAIERGVFGSTILKRGVKIDNNVGIGHNSVIGENSVITLGAILGGSVTLGANCMIGLGAIIRNGMTICDNVIIGQGSNVVCDITESGIYMGSPAKFYKPYDKDWNF